MGPFGFDAGVIAPLLHHRIRLHCVAAGDTSSTVSGASCILEVRRAYAISRHVMKLMTVSVTIGSTQPSISHCNPCVANPKGW